MEWRSATTNGRPEQALRSSGGEATRRWVLIMDRPASVRRTSSPSLKPGEPKSFDGLEVRRTGHASQYLA